MPTVSQFFGISIFMLWNDHEPPHFHARYGEYHATVEILSGAMIGKLPPRVSGMVQEWRVLHQDELMSAWAKARLKEPIPTIEPLE